MRTRWLAVFFALAPCALSAEARAEGHGLAGTTWVEAAGAYMPNAGSDAPSLFVQDVSGAARSGITGSTRPLTVPMGLFGVRGGLDFVASDLVIVPLVDLGIYGAVGVYSDALASVDGSLFRMHPAGSFMLDVEFLGVGLRFKKRRWMVEGTLKPGVALLAIPTEVADGGTFTSTDAQVAASFTLRASLSLCRRLDPTQRVCLSATPNVYQWGWGNGGSLSLRWELGP